MTKNSTTFLTVAELAELTDRQLPSKQIEWLEDFKWKFAISAAGRPKVSRSYYEHRLGALSADTDNHIEPDFSRWMTTPDGGEKKKEPRARNEPPIRLRGQAENDLLHG